jgi:hypothetical protein
MGMPKQPEKLPVNPCKTSHCLHASRPMPGPIFGRVIAEAPDAEIGIVGHQGNGREAEPWFLGRNTSGEKLQQYTGKYEERLSFHKDLLCN